MKRSVIAAMFCLFPLSMVAVAEGNDESPGIEMGQQSGQCTETYKGGKITSYADAHFSYIGDRATVNLTGVKIDIEGQRGDKRSRQVVLSASINGVSMGSTSQQVDMIVGTTKSVDISLSKIYPASATISATIQVDSAKCLIQMKDSSSGPKKQ